MRSSQALEDTPQFVGPLTHGFTEMGVGGILVESSCIFEADDRCYVFEDMRLPSAQGCIARTWWNQPLTFSWGWVDALMERRMGPENLWGVFSYPERGAGRRPAQRSPGVLCPLMHGPRVQSMPTTPESTSGLLESVPCTPARSKGPGNESKSKPWLCLENWPIRHAIWAPCPPTEWAPVLTQ